MRQIFPLTIVLAISFFVMAAADGQENREMTDKALLRNIFDQQAKAWNRGDLKQFMESYWKSPELTFSGGGKTTRGWQETLKRYQKSYSTREKMGHLTFSDLEITILGPNAALVLGRWHLKREADEPEGNFSVVFRRIGGKWLIIHDHSSTLEKTDD